MSAIESSFLDESVRPVLRAVPDEVADCELGVEELGSRIVGLSGRLAASLCRWLLLVAQFDAREGCARFGLGTTARWLAHYCGLSRRTANDHVRVARALAAHAPLAQAMAAGRLSYSHVRAISRIADRGGPALVADLINVAEQGSVGQLEDMVRGLRTVDDNERATGGEAIPESLSHRWRPDSRWGLSAGLDPEHGALVQSALEAIAHAEGLSRAQALTRIAEIALATLAGTDGELPALRGDEQAAILIHLDAAAVPPGPAGAKGSAEPGGHELDVARMAEFLATTELPGSAEPEPPRPYARIDRGPGLPERVIQRLLCLGRIRTVVYDPTTDDPDSLRRTPLDIGARRRVATKKQFKALMLRDGGCAHPGCGSRHRLEAHHVRHWIHGGPTTMTNLVLLCERHHHAQHDGEFTIRPTRRRGRFTFHRPDGSELPRRPDPASVINTTEPLENEHDHVQPNAATTHWDGTRLDHHHAVAGLAQRLNSVDQRKAG